MAETIVSAPPAPSAIVTGSGGHYNHNYGIQGKDAVLIHQAETAHAARDVAVVVSANSKENAVAVMDVKAVLGSEIKDLARQSEQLARETQLMITRDGFATRQLALEAEIRAKDGNIALLNAKLIAKGVV